MNGIPSGDARRLPLAPSLILSAALAFFMVFCAIPEVIFCRYMVVLVFVLLLFVAVRSRLVTALSILPCMMAFLAAESSPSFALLLCAVAVIGYGGFAITAVHPILVIATPVAAYLLGFAITANPMRALFSLTLVPFAVVAAVSLRLRLSRTASVAAVSTALVIGFLALVVLSVIVGGGSLSADTLRAFVLYAKELLTQSLTPLTEVTELSAIFGVTAETVSATVNSILRLSPTMLIVPIEILSYLACLIAITLRGSQFPDEELPARCRLFRMSAPSAVLFLVSFALSLLPAGRSDAFGIFLVSALNLALILMPGLALCGAIQIFVSFRKKRSLPPLLLIILCLWFSSLLPMILACVGAFGILRTEKAWQKNQQP
ncbi:MAG: hypothetical protein J6D16_02620 [Clostridia bacterium]|nr:hypothetical protein [Clostridia bacterium]